MELKLENGVVVAINVKDETVESEKVVKATVIDKITMQVKQLQENFKRSFTRKNKPEVVSDARTAAGIVQDVNKRRSAGSVFRRELDILFSVKDGLTVENIPNAILAVTFGSIAIDFVFYQLDQITPLPMVISLLPLAGLGLVAYCVKVYLDIVEPRGY